MFRRKAKPLVKETVFPADLTKLGLFINDEDRLRQIEKPDEGFDYYLHGKFVSFDGRNTKERLNERRREAVDECMRREALSRLESLGLKRFRMPLGAADDEPHLNILLPESLSTARRILLIIPDAYGTDLGIWNVRNMTDGILSNGSMEAVVLQAKALGYAVVIGNPSQLFWDKLTKKALTHASYKARDRSETITHNAAARIDTEETTIPSNANPEEHVASIMEYLSKNMNPKVEIDILTVGYSAHCILTYLHNNWDTWKEHVHAVALAESTHALNDLPSPEFRFFLSKRARSWVCSPEERGKELEPDTRFGCAKFSAEETWAGNIVPHCLSLIMDYLKLAREKPDDCNPDIPILVGDPLGEAERQNWMEALQKLELGDTNIQGWEVPGMKEVAAMKKAQDAMDARNGLKDPAADWCVEEITEEEMMKDEKAKEVEEAKEKEDK